MCFHVYIARHSIFHSEFTKRLRGESEIEVVLRRLDRLTREEAQMTVQGRGRHPMFAQVAQTLGVVHGLVCNMKVVMEGVHAQ